MPNLKVRKDFFEEKFFSDRKSDREIWVMFKNGDKGAFRDIYVSNYEHLHKFGHRITNDSELIKDSIQDLFIELNNGKNISDTDSIRFYLLKALKFKLEKKLKRQRDFIQFNHNDSFDGLGIEMSDEIKHINLQIEAEQKNQIQHLLSKLTKNQRQALYYFYYENFSYKEIAEIMSLSHVRSARNLIYKALSSVRTYLKIIVSLLLAVML